MERVDDTATRPNNNDSVPQMDFGDQQQQTSFADTQNFSQRDWDSARTTTTGANDKANMMLNGFELTDKGKERGAAAPGSDNKAQTSKERPSLTPPADGVERPGVAYVPQPGGGFMQIHKNPQGEVQKITLANGNTLTPSFREGKRQSKEEGTVTLNGKELSVREETWNETDKKGEHVTQRTLLNYVGDNGTHRLSMKDPNAFEKQEKDPDYKEITSEITFLNSGLTKSTTFTNGGMGRRVDEGSKHFDSSGKEISANQLFGGKLPKDDLDRKLATDRAGTRLDNFNDRMKAIQRSNTRLTGTESRDPLSELGAGSLYPVEQTLQEARQTAQALARAGDMQGASQVLDKVLSPLERANKSGAIAGVDRKDITGDANKAPEMSLNQWQKQLTLLQSVYRNQQ